MHGKVRLLGTILKALFCVLLLSVATYAWISSNRNSDSGSMTIQLDGESMSITEYDVLRFNQETLEVDQVNDTYEVFNLIPYDSIFTERNVNTPLLLRVLLEGVPGDTLYFTIECDPGHNTPKKLSNGNARWTSDIVYLKYTTETALNTALGTTVNEDMILTKAGRKTMYDTVVSYLLANNANRVQFATATGSNYSYTYNSTKETELECAVSLTGDDLTNRRTVVYIIIDYDPELIIAQSIQNIGEFDIRLGLPVQFSSDITRISFTGIQDQGGE